MNKFLVSVLALTVSAFAFADELDVKDYNYRMTDIADRGVTKEALFKSMNRDSIRLGDSICANRAHMWSFDFKRSYDVDAAKIFLFYTAKSGSTGATNWWYHVAPVIGEHGQKYVMDAGFTGSILGPVSKEQWLKRFAGSTKCKEIEAKDEDLLKRMFRSAQFPETTSHGTFDCYYKIVPAGYWYPASVAMSLLGVNSKGEPVTFVRDEIRRDEVYRACVEAVTSDLGRILGGGKKKCKEYYSM